MPPAQDDKDRPDRKTTAERLDTVERDVEAMENADKTFSVIQLQQFRLLISEALGNVGLRIDDPTQVDEARRDFTFVRNLRKGVNGTASKIGWFVIAAILSGFVWVMQAGLNFWK